MRIISVAFSVLLFASSACFGRVRTPSPGDPSPQASAYAWLSAQPIICGELRGRVHDVLTGRPVVGARVSLDSLALASTTNDDGEFRIGLWAPTAALAGVRARARVSVRGVGYRELHFMLGGNAGYVLAIGLAQLRVPFEGPTDTTAKVSTLGIKEPGKCVPSGTGT